MAEHTDLPDQSVQTEGRLNSTPTSTSEEPTVFPCLTLPIVNVPLLATALIQSALSAALSKSALEFLRMATQTSSFADVPTDLRTLHPPVTQEVAQTLSENSNSEPLPLIKRLNSTAQNVQQAPKFPQNSCLPPMPESEGPLDFSAPTEHSCTYPGCTKTFRYNHALINHYRIHTGEKPYACDYPGCKQAFARQSNLLTHRMVHLNRAMRRTFACTVPGCEKNFLKKTNLDDHMNLHLNKRPYICDFPSCGKSFRCRSNLSGHKRVHTRGIEKEIINRPSPLERKIDNILAKARASVATNQSSVEDKQETSLSQ